MLINIAYAASSTPVAEPDVSCHDDTGAIVPELSVNLLGTTDATFTTSENVKLKMLLVKFNAKDVNVGAMVLGVTLLAAKPFDDAIATTFSKNMSSTVVLVIEMNVLLVVVNTLGCRLMAFKSVLDNVIVMIGEFWVDATLDDVSCT